MKKTNGFTLIELLITLTIVIILAAVSVWLYTSKIRASRRTDGINTLSSISMAEERYRTTNTQYGTLAQVWNGVSTSSEGYYSIAITNVTSSSYTITATAIGDQANDTQNGTSCSTLQLAASNGTITQTPTACWPQ